MRKLLCILFTVLYVFGIELACAEYTNEKTVFGLQWLANDSDVIQHLTEMKMLSIGESTSAMPQEDVLYIISDDATGYRPYREAGYSEVTYGMRIGIKGKMAGYPIKSANMVYAYDGDYKLIAVKVELLNADYDELKSKLNRVYGEGEYFVSVEGIESLVWKDDNNSAVLLYTESEGINYTLMYGRLDATDILQNCLAPADPDDVSGL